MITKVKCKLQLTAIVVVCAYLMCFIPKTIADSLRLFEKNIDHRYLSAIQLFVTVSDRVRRIIVYLLIMAMGKLHEKLQSQSP